MATQPQWQQKLQERGILTAALEAGWKPRGLDLVKKNLGKPNGWEYPLWNLDEQPYMTHRGDQRVTRWKNFNSAEEPKYWFPVGGHGAHYYCFPGLRSEIERAGGQIIVANGDCDTLAFKAAGYHNVISWFGEGSQPTTFWDDMKSLGVTSVECYPDRDDEGYNMAQKLYQTCPSDITMSAFILPEALGPKGDINKLWIACEFNEDAFTAQLVSCEMLTKEPAPEPPSLPLFKPRDDRRELPLAFLDAIEARLGATGYGSDGYSANFSCPMYPHADNDKTPSAGWSRETHTLKCFKCEARKLGRNKDGVYLAVEVGEQLGIRLKDYGENQRKIDIRQAMPSQPLSANGQPEQPSAPLFVASDDALAEVINADATIMPPLPMAFEAISQVGGFARFMSRGKIVAVVAPSGGFKTTFMEMNAEFWRMRGYSGAWFGEEFTPKEYQWRTIQHDTGYSYEWFMLDEAWQAEDRQGVPMQERLGKPFTSQQRAEIERSKATIRQWPGKMYYTKTNGHETTIDDVLASMRAIAAHARSIGQPLSFAVLDYAQLFNTDKRTSELEQIARAVSLFKTFCIQEQLVGLVGSQVGKEDSRAATSATGRDLDMESMVNLRAFKFNLVLSLRRQINEATGEDEDKLSVRVGKNSVGPRSKKVNLIIDNQRMCLIDTVSYDLRDYSPGF